VKNVVGNRLEIKYGKYTNTMHERLQNVISVFDQTENHLIMVWQINIRANSKPLYNPVKNTCQYKHPLGLGIKYMSSPHESQNPKLYNQSTPNYDPPG